MARPAIVQQPGETDDQFKHRNAMRIGWLDAHDEFCDFGPYSDCIERGRHKPCPFDDPKKA